MLVVSRFRVPPEGADDFATRARAALDAFAGRPGFLRGRVGRSVDEPDWWAVLTEWDSVGSYRRALSAYEVKLTAAPLLGESVDEPGAYEVLAASDGGPVALRPSARAADADTAGPGGG